MTQAKITTKFYAVFGTEAKAYLGVDGTFDDENFNDNDISHARRFDTIESLLNAVQEDPDLGSIEIHRVTEEVVNGGLRILGLNEAAPEDAEIKFVAYNTYFDRSAAPLPVASQNGACDLTKMPYPSYSVALDEAPLFATERLAMQAIRDSKANGIGVRRVVTTPSTSKLTATVVE